MLTQVYLYDYEITYLNDTLKLFSLPIHKINKSLMKNNVSNIENSEETNQTREPSETFSYS